MSPRGEAWDWWSSVYRTTMGSHAGRIAAHDLSAAESLFADVLGANSSWCNLSFEPLDDPDMAPESVLFGFLAARGPANPLATIMAAVDGRRPRPVEIGIQHRAGTKAAAQLREANLLLPDGTRVAQDHPRRGLVIEWPNVEAATLVLWLFPAMRVLGRAPTSGDVLYTWNGAPS